MQLTLPGATMSAPLDSSGPGDPDLRTGDSLESIELISTGEFVDPRSSIVGRVAEVFDATTNVNGKAQRSARVVLEDGTTVLVSGFGAKAAKLEGVKPGFTYSFKGRKKVKKTIFNGHEQESTFFNL